MSIDNKQFQTQFSEMLRNYPQALSDRRKLIGLMHDLFPEEQMRVNLAILAFDLGIKEDIDRESCIDESILTRYSMRMVQGHGISTDNAKWCATLWCISYGRDCLCKPLQFNMPEEKMGAYPNALELDIVEKKFPKLKRVKVLEPSEDAPLTYNYPPIDLLAQGEVEDTSAHGQRDMQKAKLLEETLQSFGISAKLTGIAHGPAVTRFELQPAPGVKVSRITSLSDDIALNLAAMSVRIEAPIPGKAAIGVEIPNDMVEMVRLRDVLESSEARKHPSRIAVGLGKDNSGRYIVADIAKMPHVLIAGQTGSGKSVCINAIIASILLRASPEEVKLILIDPKVVELSVYNNIPHLVCPVVTDPRKASSALDWAVAEMTKRYKLFAERGVRDIKGYNKSLKDGEKLMPQMVIIIDELADLMIVSPVEVEDSICRLAQLARSCGMHLVISSQHPTKTLFTDKIKNSFPTRIAFSMMSQAESRMMLNQAGAEDLLGNGDMMFLPNGMRPMRVQGAFVSANEVHAIVEYIKQSGETEYDPDMLEHMEIATRSYAEKEEFEAEYDSKLPEAVDIAIDLGQVSISMLQRKMRIGYARAGRIIDEMSRRGIVSMADGSAPREVLITREQARKIFEDDWDGGAGTNTTPPVISKEALMPSPKPTMVTPSYPPQKQSVGRRPMILPYAPRKAKTQQPEIKYPLHPQSRLSGDNYEIWVADNEIFIHRIQQGATGGRIVQTDIHFTAGKIKALVIKLPRLFSKKAFIQFGFEKDIGVINKSIIKNEWMEDTMLTIPYPPENKKEFQTFMQQIADDMGIELEKM